MDVRRSLNDAFGALLPVLAAHAERREPVQLADPRRSVPEREGCAVSGRSMLSEHRVRDTPNRLQPVNVAVHVP
jgi:hypothetical protein